MELGAEGRSREPEGPGPASCGRVGSRGAGGVPHVGRLACHTACPVGPSAGVGRAGGSVVEFLSNHPGESSGPPMAPGRELRVGLGALLAVHWPVPTPRVSPCTSSSVSCLTTPLPPVLGWASGVWAWLAAGAPHRRPGPGDAAGLSGPGAAVSEPRAGAVAPVIGASASPVGLTTSPAGTWPLSDGTSGLQYLSKAHQMPATGKSPGWTPSGDAGPSRLVIVSVQWGTCL